MGASLADAQATMKLIAGENASATHPGKAIDLQQLKTVGRVPAGSDRKRCLRKTERPTRPVQTSGGTNKVSNPDRRVSRFVNFRNRYRYPGQVLLKPDQNARNYVTDGLNVFRTFNNNLSAVGKLSRSNNSKYPFVIYDNSNKRLFVDRTGIF
jgi:hypothetical protein